MLESNNPRLEHLIELCSSEKYNSVAQLQIYQDISFYLRWGVKQKEDYLEKQPGGLQ